MNMEELREKIIVANKAYRIGEPIISDSEYDLLLEELSLLSPDDELLTKVGFVVEDENRKVNLPIPMFSVNKTKTISEIYDWIRLKLIPTNELLIITPKFDGLSLCVNESTKEAITRGDGSIGQRCSEHYKLIKNHTKSNPSFDFTYGEIMMSRQTFADKYSKDFANPRNLVAGLINSKSVSESLKDCEYIKYGGIPNKDFTTKQEILDELNKNQESEVEYHISDIKNIDEELLIDLFKRWSEKYEIDGLIVEVNSLELQEKLGRERSSSNPVFLRAFKHSSFEQSAETEILNISWKISKHGLLKPVANVRAISVGGTTIENCTLNNAKFVKDNNLGIGSIVQITRSGGVIPKITKVIKATGFEMPEFEDFEIGWNENCVELITLSITDNQEFQKIVSFFEILEADSIREGVIKQLWNAGYTTIKDILNLTMEDLRKLDGFGDRKSEIVFSSIRKSVSGISLSKLQHATGIFVGLGSKKLILLEHFEAKPTINQVMEIAGFATKSAQCYVDSYDTFFEFIKDLPVNIKKKIATAVTDGDLEGMSFCFTGVRDKNIEADIEKRAGRIASGVSAKTTHLIMKEIGSGSSKEQKAIQLGIKIMTLEDLYEFLEPQNA